MKSLTYRVLQKLSKLLGGSEFKEFQEYRTFSTNKIGILPIPKQTSFSDTVAKQASFSCLNKAVLLQFQYSLIWAVPPFSVPNIKALTRVK